jgi:hypothetical protein
LSKAGQAGAAKGIVPGCEFCSCERCVEKPVVLTPSNEPLQRTGFAGR